MVASGPAPRASVIARMTQFLAVGELMSFSRAAERLGIAQPALSRSIRELEKELGFRLFERSTRRVALTDAGEVLFRDATDAMHRLSRGVSQAARVAQGLSGKINIGYSIFAATGPMSDIIIEFRKRHPDAQVGLRVLASPEQSAALDDATIDLGFMMANVSTTTQRWIPVTSERLVALVQNGHPSVQRQRISFGELAAGPLVVGTVQRWRGFRTLMDDMASAHGLSLSIAEEADDVPLLLQLVRSGFGCTVLDTSCIPTLPPGITPLELDGIETRLDISLVWNERNASPLVARFADVARQFLDARGK